MCFHTAIADQLEGLIAELPAAVLAIAAPPLRPAVGIVPSLLPLFVAGGAARPLRQTQSLSLNGSGYSLINVVVVFKSASVNHCS